MANPQAENGHVDIANELVEAFARTRISGTEMQLVWVVLRKTYGWHKKEDTIALAQFTEMTNIPKPDIVRYLKKLLGKKIIVVGQNDNGIKIYSINKDFDTWEPLGKKITLGKNPITVGQNDNKPLGKNRTTKEKKEKKETPLLSPEGSADRKPDNCPHKNIIELYHKLLPMLPRVREPLSVYWHDDRKEKLRTRWREEPDRQNLEWWQDFFDYVKSCPHLIGQNDRGWQPNLEWLVERKNFIKVVEGNYEPRKLRMVRR